MTTPQTIGPFKVISPLGKGGMGSVYLATDDELQREVAVKVLTEAGDEELRKRFTREARSAAAVSHPNIATIYQVGRTDDDVPWIAMEYCQGETLTRLIRGRTITASRLIDLAIQIASGLEAAHRNGIIHRDIKSSNVMVEPNDVVKILDFGLARPIAPDQGDAKTGDLTVGRFFGTIPYLSPEQARGEGADTRSDLFSLGVVIYEMASGRLPFHAENPLDLLHTIQSKEPDPIDPIDPELPQEIAAVIGRLLQKNPDDRYQSAAELIIDLEEIQQKYGFSESSRRSRERSSRTFRMPSTSTGGTRRRALLGILIAVILASAAFLVWERIDRGTGGDLANQPIRSLAVLPFTNMSGSQNEAFLSIGLADALATRLQQLPDLNVRPTSSVTRYRDGADVAGAARELAVDAIIEGTYITSGDQVRVTLQLIDSRTGYGIWAANLDGPRSNLLALLDTVASTTVRALQNRLTQQPASGRSEVRTSHPEAFEHYLRARAYAGSLVQEDFEAQVSALARAIEIDPEFAAAHAELAIALSLGKVRGLAADNVRQSPLWYAQQAVRLDPNLPAAHLALGRALVRQPDRFRESARENLAALRLEPSNPDALFTMISYLVSTGDLQRASCVEERFLAVDPTSNDARTRGYWDVNAVDPDAALADSALALQSPETSLAGHDIAALAHLMRSDTEAAEQSRSAAKEIAPDHYVPKSLDALVLAASGQRAAAIEALEGFRHDRETNHWAALREVLVWSKLGETERAVEAAERAQRLGNHSWYFLVRHPWLAPLQSEPRFQTVLREIRSDLDDVREDVLGVYELICPAG